jgi:hypothetical protein
MTDRGGAARDEGSIVRILEGVQYILLAHDRIRAYVTKVCEEEWDPPDFGAYGPDLYESEWGLEKVPVRRIAVNEELLARDSFQREVAPRIARQEELRKARTPIPPLILRGRDKLILDGYARYHMLKRAAIARCFAYVGHRRRDPPAPPVRAPARAPPCSPHP